MKSKVVFLNMLFAQYVKLIFKLHVSVKKMEKVLKIFHFM